MHWIKQAISRYIMNNGRTIRMPVHILEKYYMIHRCIEKYNNEYGEEPPVEYIVKETGLAEKNVKDLCRYYTNNVCISLNQEINLEDSHSRTELLDLLPDPAVTIADSTNFEQDMQLMIQKIKSILTEKEFGILDMRFGLTQGSVMTLEEVGKVYGCTRERIRQIEKKAIMKLQTPKNMRYFKEFEDYLK